MNSQISKVLAHLNKRLSDELNQPTSFPTARSNKIKSEKPNEAQNQIKPKEPSGLGFFKKPRFFGTRLLGQAVAFHILLVAIKSSSVLPSVLFLRYPLLLELSSD